MKGFITLGAERSGTTWLKSMTNVTGVMGNAEEWLNKSNLDKSIKEYTPETHYDFVLAKPMTTNDRFGLKVFPNHFNHVYFNLGYDFLQRCHAQSDLLIILLRRKDTLAQAISLARAHQSKRYSSPAIPIAPEVYDFRKTCRFYFSRSYQYWEAYLNAMGFSYHELAYEDLVQDPSAYVDTIRAHLDVEVSGDWSSDLQILRDATTEEWKARFRADAAKYGVIDLAHGRESPSRTFANFFRFLRKKPLTPYPFHVIR